ncbi:ferrochelatase [Paenibacillus alvei]|uniref:Coproporphyrin III ferrochelatase n=1 Tax=Paenibacillus alvei TaxID=44250 RepID=A0ABT4H610_PAEAL|nr:MULTISPECIES: ferrochelatase [Paenibacillus]EJW17645.1 ferrochelatase HemH [Paenibacillus alvei DSM 29]MCY9540614.1 ferrochelatase [Paenibacillus alvei]MCY9707015.1 ferrochelatase [Paenibacillus alvei]MCY9736015.1 ferrochelatase [Paenibacillus alvei]MCY9755921.1 ferrochelatase [Paenibacillus alvei]
MSKRKVGVLVMSYGTPCSMEEIEPYYTHIRRGNPPSAEQLAELKERYEAIVGGVFPLRENTDRQVAGLQHTLDRLTAGMDVQYVCYQGLKHAQPYIEDGVAAMAKDGITEAVSIVLAPHYSVMSVGGYNKRAQEEAAKHGIQMKCVNSYHLHPELIDALAKRVNEQLEAFVTEGAVRGEVEVLFSAHSLPARILEMNDPYPDELNATAAAVAKQCGLKGGQWRFTWQSAGQTAMPWLGPDILDTLAAVAEEGAKWVLSAPIGFVSDHLEVLYDLDIEALRTAEQLQIGFKRIRMLNDDPQYMLVLADTIMKLDQ